MQVQDPAALPDEPRRDDSVVEDREGEVNPPVVALEARKLTEVPDLHDWHDARRSTDRRGTPSRRAPGMTDDDRVRSYPRRPGTTHRRERERPPFRGGPRASAVTCAVEELDDGFDRHRQVLFRDAGEHRERRGTLARAPRPLERRQGR